MRGQMMILLLAVLLPAAAVGAEPKDSDKIQGVWVLTEAEDNGRTAPREELGNFVWSFNGDKYTIKYRTDIREGTFKLDPGKTPRSFEHTVTAGADKGKTYRGIYKFVGDDMVLCFPNDEKSGRPKEFTGKAGSGQSLWVFRRKKS